MAAEKIAYGESLSCVSVNAQPNVFLGEIGPEMLPIQPLLLNNWPEH